MPMKVDFSVKPEPDIWVYTGGEFRSIALVDLDNLTIEEMVAMFPDSIYFYAELVSS
jgi:hypothetical protein